MCGYYSRAATNQGAASIRINTVNFAILYTTGSAMPCSKVTFSLLGWDSRSVMAAISILPMWVYDLSDYLARFVCRHGTRKCTCTHVQ